MNTLVQVDRAASRPEAPPRTTTWVEDLAARDRRAYVPTAVLRVDAMLAGIAERVDVPAAKLEPIAAFRGWWRDGRLGHDDAITPDTGGRAESIVVIADTVHGAVVSNARGVLYCLTRVGLRTFLDRAHTGARMPDWREATASGTIGATRLPPRRRPAIGSGGFAFKPFKREADGFRTAFAREMLAEHAEDRDVGRMIDDGMRNLVVTKVAGKAEMRFDVRI